MGERKDNLDLDAYNYGSTIDEENEGLIYIRYAPETDISYTVMGRTGILCEALMNVEGLDETIFHTAAQLVKIKNIDFNEYLDKYESVYCKPVFKGRQRKKRVKTDKHVSRFGGKWFRAFRSFIGALR